MFELLDRDAAARNHLWLQHLAADFNLKYQPEIFKFSWVTKREHVLITYLVGCPVYPYIRYGKDSKTRIKNLKSFLASKDFAAECRRSHGSVLIVKHFENVIKHLKGIKEKNSFRRLIARLNRAATPWGSIILASPDSRREREFLFNTVLMHEWAHILLLSNKIFFQRIAKRYWPLDEGLATYMVAWSKGHRVLSAELKRCRAHLRKERNRFKPYAIGTLKISTLLKNKKNAQERYIAIRRYLWRLQHV